MKPIHLKAMACAVLCVAIIPVLRSMNVDAEACFEHPAVRKKARSADGGDYKTQSAIRHPQAAVQTNGGTRIPRVAAFKERNRDTKAMVAGPSPHHSAPDSPVATGVPAADVCPIYQDYRLQAVQLAGNARLPAVFMAQALPVGGGDPADSPAVKAAHQAIADRFYQELAGKSPASIGSNGSALSATSDAAEATVVIGPGPVLDEASMHADENYRSLFGNDAYNRHAMDSALEVLLPPDSVVPGN